MAYSEYPIEKVEVKALHLDVTNYRFENDVATEVSAMNYLWAEHDVADVARLILRDRYVDNEIPLVVKENRKWVVLEGNRRVAALRALQEPALAPVHQQEIERLLKRYAIEAESLPERIRVMVFPNREAAAPVLARLHIGQPKLSWNLDEQAKFVLAQLRPSSTLDQLRSGLPAIKDIGRVVRMGRIRQQLRDTKYTNKDIAEYVAGPKLAMSSFEYAYKNSDIQKIIGLSFDEESRIATWASSRSQILALERLLAGFKAGELNTRRGLKPGTTEFERLLDQMRAAGSAPASAASPSGASPGSGGGNAPGGGGGAGGGGGSSGGGGTSGSGAGRGPNNPDTKSYLDLTGIGEAKLPLTLKHRIREVRRINVTDFPAAAAMLVRSLVEAAIKEHYGLGNGITATGTLGDVMTKVTTDHKGNGQLANAISNLNRTTKDASAIPGTGQWFNLVSHSVNVDVAGKQVQQAWRVVFPLVRFMVHEKRTVPGKP